MELGNRIGESARKALGLRKRTKSPREVLRELVQLFDPEFHYEFYFRAAIGRQKVVQDDAQSHNRFRDPY